MANEIELNGLADTNNLPDDWKISLINPATLQPAQNIKVAQFIESLTGKMPVATSDTNGLFSSENSKLLSSLKYKTGASSDSQYILLMRTADFHYSQGCALIWAGNLSSYLIGPICAVLKKNSIPVLTSLDGNIGLNRGYYYRVHNDMLELYVESDNGIEVSITPIGYFGVTYPLTVSGDPGGLTRLEIRTSRSMAASANALTETTSLNNSILPPPANCVPNSSITDSSVEQFAVSAVSDSASQEDSTPVKSELSGEQYVWSIDKIGKAVLELQAENKRLKQILNISDDSEVQQM